MVVLPDHWCHGARPHGHLDQYTAVTESMESLAYVLALTRIRRRGLTQGERVQDLLAERDPQAVYDHHRHTTPPTHTNQLTRARRQQLPKARV